MFLFQEIILARGKGKTQNVTYCGRLLVSTPCFLLASPPPWFHSSPTSLRLQGLNLFYNRIELDANVKEVLSGLVDGRDKKWEFTLAASNTFALGLPS
jgi:hypothetical protein